MYSLSFKNIGSVSLAGLLLRIDDKSTVSWYLCLGFYLKKIITDRSTQSVSRCARNTSSNSVFREYVVSKLEDSLENG